MKFEVKLLKLHKRKTEESSCSLVVWQWIFCIFVRWQQGKQDEGLVSVSSLANACQMDVNDGLGSMMHPSVWCLPSGCFLVLLCFEVCKNMALEFSFLKSEEPLQALFCAFFPQGVGVFFGQKHCVGFCWLKVVFLGTDMLCVWSVSSKAKKLKRWSHSGAHTCRNNQPISALYGQSLSVVKPCKNKSRSGGVLSWSALKLTHAADLLTANLKIIDTADWRSLRSVF